jgi:excisionase family DNA binding protein
MCVPTVLRLLGIDSVAVKLDCSTRHVRRLADSGSMPKAIRLGKLVRWLESEIDEWIALGCPKLNSRRRT